MDENEDPVAAPSEIIRTDPITLFIVGDSAALDHERGDEALRRWFDPARMQWDPPTGVTSEEEDDLPPFDYNDEGEAPDPLFVTLNHALWAPLDETEHRAAYPARLGRDVLEAFSDEQDEAEDNEKTLELALSFSVPRTKSQYFQEVMRDARVVQGHIKLPASEDCARPTRLVLTANRNLSDKSRPFEALRDGRRRLLDATVTGCLGGLVAAANTLHSQLFLVAGFLFAAQCVRLAVPTPLIGERRLWRMLRRLAPRRRRGAM
ncbi:hypothetical protein [Streptomyces sp.]|uniref:hypothetical protein n=1 Tax=Streptomyces sp. TaxID=1931 RepID=UPI002D7A340E|nr:hypothetical protein [Streptomyces sp.]HET6354619.1 hypothetical protein [Streptomyces sp.]